MSKPNISLIVGNGLSISYGHYSGLASKWDTQEPISWDISCPVIGNGNGFLNSLPSLKKLTEKYRKITSFDIFSKALDKEVCRDLGVCNRKATLEARHFLTIAFSKYALEQKMVLEGNRSWPWYNWIRNHKNEIRSVFSLNYDLLLESVFDDLRKQYFSLQVNHHGYGIPFVKPHGSVDFELAPNTISCPVSYPLAGFIDLNNTPIIRLKKENLIYPRLQPLCIIPNEANRYLNYQWVAPANEWFNKELSSCTHCVFIGVSYFPCDRPEIDNIIDSLPSSAQIIVANPCPPKNFMEKVKGRPVLLWNSHNGPIDEHGDLLPLKNERFGRNLVRCFCNSGLSYRYCCGNKVL